MITPAEKYRLLAQTDPEKLTPVVVSQLRAEAASLGQDALDAFLNEMVQGTNTTPNKKLLLG